MPQPACLANEERELLLYVPQPHTAKQLAEISEQFERNLEALGSDYELSGVMVGHTLRRRLHTDVADCTTLIAQLEWRDGGPELPFTQEHVDALSQQLNTKYAVWGRSSARVVYDPVSTRRVAVVATLETSVDNHTFSLGELFGKRDMLDIGGTEVYAASNAAGRSVAHIVIPDPLHRGSPKLRHINEQVLKVADQLGIFLVGEPELVDQKPGAGIPQNSEFM